MAPRGGEGVLFYRALWQGIRRGVPRIIFRLVAAKSSAVSLVTVTFLVFDVAFVC